MPFQPHYRPRATWSSLGRLFYTVAAPARFPDLRLRYRNRRWADRLALGTLGDDEWVDHFGRFRPLPGSLAEPLALPYHGHQFHLYNPDLGDGRGFLFAEVEDPVDGRLLAINTKGSGETAFARDLDGRLALAGGVREVLAAEMLEAQGVYTAKALSLIETGERVYREDGMHRGAVLIRLSHSVLRIGSFQRLAALRETEALERLIRFTLAHCLPEAPLPGKTEDAAVAFLDTVSDRLAAMSAAWMVAGFAHGVLNTDNMSVLGESFDYGPWRFLPHFDPGFTAAYFDQTGLYAFGRQAEACAWNLAQLGGALSRHAHADALNEALQTFSDCYETAMADAYFRRLGLERTGDGDFAFVVDFLKWMTQTGAPYEQVFFDWFCGKHSEGRAQKSAAAELYDQEQFAAVKERLRGFGPLKPDRLQHDYFQPQKPCTMLIDEVEAIWAPIAENDDWSRFEAKLREIAGMREAYGFSASEYRLLPKTR